MERDRSMVKQPDPNCRFCKGGGLIVRPEPVDGRIRSTVPMLPCVCTSDYSSNDLPMGRERVV